MAATASIARWSYSERVVARARQHDQSVVLTGDVRRDRRGQPRMRDQRRFGIGAGAQVEGVAVEAR